MGHYDDLRVRRSGDDEPGKCRQQVRMEAGFRLIEYHELRRSRCEKSRRPEKVSQCSIGQLRGGKWTEQSMLLQLQLETAILHLDIKPAAGEGVFECSGESLVRSDFQNGLKSSGKIAAIVIQYRRKCADLGDSSG